MRLDSPSKQFELVLSAAKTTTDMDVCLSFEDAPSGSVGSLDTVTNGTTAVPICYGPDAGVVRTVRSLSVMNTDTAAKTVTVRLNNNGTIRKILTWTLAVGDTLIYTDGAGFYLASMLELQGVSLGTNVAALLASFTSANLAAALTDEIGTGKAVFGTARAAFTPVLRDGITGTAATATVSASYAITNGVLHYWMRFQNIDTTGPGLTAGNPVYITDMPQAAVSGTYHTAPVLSVSCSPTTGCLLAFLSGGTDYFSLYNGITTGIASFLVSQITSGSGDLHISGSYPIS